MSVKITADSTGDLSPALCQKYNITVAPLSVIVDGQVYKDGAGITAAEIFAAADAGKSVKTAAVNRYEYEELFSALLKKYGQVVHICMSGAMSSCYSDACEAAEAVGNVYVVDSRSLSTGTGMLALKAAEMAREGADAPAIAEALRGMTDLVCASFTVRDIDYLRRGGRCGGLAAMGAKLMHIRPSIEVKNGGMLPGRKYRGSYEHYLKHYMDDLFEEVPDPDPARAFVTHSPCDDGMAEFATEYLRASGRFEEVLETDAGATVCVHCGPNTLGVLFMRKHA